MKPLHVQVAEALGWTGCYLRQHFGPMEMLVSDLWVGSPPRPTSNPKIPRYDTDWNVTGPLIEKLPIALGKFHPDHFNGLWYAVAPGFDASHEVQAETHGPTPLIAACNLILELHKAGKLPDTHTVDQPHNPQ